MNENQIRQIVQEELRRNESGSRFGVKSIPYHTHNGKDSVQIIENSIIPSGSITGMVTFAQETTYRLRLNSTFTPQSIQVNGIITGTYSSRQTRVLVVGSAQLTPTFYFQDPNTAATPDTYVVTGGMQFPANGKPAQSGSYISVTRGGTADFFAGATEDHLVSVAFPTLAEDNIKARVTVIGFSKDEILIDVPYLDTDNDWEVTLNFVIT
jgi:hypothetical protein